jgi:hypothetical protein
VCIRNIATGFKLKARLKPHNVQYPPNLSINTDSRVTEITVWYFLAKLVEQGILSKPRQDWKMDNDNMLNDRRIKSMELHLFAK